MAEFKKIEVSTQQELFEAEIQKMIISGELPIGSRLPSIRELSTRMGVSRANVESGVSSLEAQGFLEVQARKGIRVADYKTKGSLAALNGIMRYNDYEMDEQIGDSLYRVRTDIETSVAEMAASHRSEGDLELMSAHLECMRETDDACKLAEESSLFHHQLCIASGNMVYPMLYYSFHELICAILAHMYEHSEKTPRIDDQKEILDAVHDGDAARSKQAMGSFLDRELDAIHACLR